MNMWLRTSEYGEVKSALTACIDFAKQAQLDISYAKWLILAMHNAVQGCMVIALTRSDGFGAIREEDEIAWHKAYETEGPFPERPERLLDFLSLYKRIKKPRLIDYCTSAFQSKPKHDRSIKKLNIIRNEFIHFTPKGWSLDVSGLPAICTDCIDVCRFLITNCGKFSIFADSKPGELESLLDNLQQVVDRLFVDSLADKK